MALLVSSELIETAAPVSNSISSGLPSTLRATWMGLGRVSLNLKIRKTSGVFLLFLHSVCAMFLGVLLEVWFVVGM